MSTKSGFLMVLLAGVAILAVGLSPRLTNAQVGCTARGLTGSYTVPQGQYCKPYSGLAQIQQSGLSLSLVNECGQPTTGQITGPNSFTSGWGVSATVSADCTTINWNNGSVWEVKAPTSSTFFGTPGTSTNPTASVAEPVNTATGAYYTSHTDLRVPSKGLAFTFTRFYNSPDPYSGPLGVGWTHSYNSSLTENAGNGMVTIKQGDGGTVAFAPAGAGTYKPSTAGLFDTLQKNGDGSFTLTRKDQTEFHFSALGRLVSIVDRNGNTHTLAYDGSGNLRTVTDSAGRVFTFTYDGSHRLISVTDPMGRVVQYAYDAAGNLISCRDALEGLTQYTYDANHRMIAATDPHGIVYMHNTYDAQGRVVLQTNARGFATTFAYDTPSPGTTTITDPLGNVTQHLYDSKLRFIAVVDAHGGSTSFTYDDNNLRTSVTNPNDEMTHFTYDAQGNVTGITDPIGNTGAFAYDAKSNLLSATDATGNTRTFAYDLHSNLIAFHDALGNTITFAHDGAGQILSTTDARGNTTTFTYDAFGNLTQTADALGNRTTLDYDGLGRLVSLTDANGHTGNLTYDALDRPVILKDALGNATHLAYDANGNRGQSTDANGKTTSYGYDTTNNLVSVTDALGHVTAYTYDANNNRLTFTNAKGNRKSYEYDALSRVVRIIDPLSFVTSYAYDAVGNSVAVTDANGKTTQLAYDARNRLTTVTYADGTSVAYAYDANGNRTTMVDGHGKTSYTYDALYRLTAVQPPDGQVVRYAYDALGNRQSLLYPDGKVLQYAYDAGNRLTGVTDWRRRTTTYRYDAVNTLLGVSYPNRTGLAFAYDAANRLSQVRNIYRGSDDEEPNPITSFTYTLDRVGNRLGVTDGNGKTTSYSYDALYQLTAVTTEDGRAVQFSYDAVGNRVNQTGPRPKKDSIKYAYDAADRLLTAGAATFTYDANGNPRTKTDRGVTLTYAYDLANRLSAVSGGNVHSRFAYDGDGHRMTQATSTGTYSYLNDVAAGLPVVLQESGPDGEITYTHGLRLIAASAPDFEFFYHYDGLGSVVGLTDTRGHLKKRYGYDAWGQTVRAVPPPKVGTQNKFHFTGEALDPETGLYYVRARYYDPAIGRFLTRDPIGEAGGLNLYAYVGNNPVNRVDPFGLDPLETTDRKYSFDNISFDSAITVLGIFQGPMGVEGNVYRPYTGTAFDIPLVAWDWFGLPRPGPALPDASVVNTYSGGTLYSRNQGVPPDRIVSAGYSWIGQSRAYVNLDDPITWLPNLSVSQGQISPGNRNSETIIQFGWTIPLGGGLRSGGGSGHSQQNYPNWPYR